MLHLCEHTSKNSNNSVIGPVDLEGHRGKDGRYYLLDFARLFPAERPTREKENMHIYKLLRSEFVRSYGGRPLCSDAYSPFLPTSTLCWNIYPIIFFIFHTFPIKPDPPQISAST